MCPQNTEKFGTMVEQERRRHAFENVIDVAHYETILNLLQFQQPRVKNYLFAI